MNDGMKKPQIQENAMRYMLLSVTRSELELIESFYPTKKAAFDAMVEDIILSTPYETLDELRSSAEKDLCGFSDTEAWAETHQFGTGQWNIVELPTSPGSPGKVFVYKEYNDDYDYGEELVKVFSHRDDAMRELKKSVEEYFGVPWDSVPSRLDPEEDIFSDDHISAGNGRGGTVHWVVEEHETN